MRRHWKCWLALVVSWPALIVALPVNRFLNKLLPDVPKNILTNLPFCTFYSFLIVLLAPFINKPDTSRDNYFYTSLEIINVKLRKAKSKERPDLKIFLWTAASVAAAAAVNPSSIKITLANGLSKFTFKDKPVSVMVLKAYLKIFLIVLFYAIGFLLILY